MADVQPVFYACIGERGSVLLVDVHATSRCNQQISLAALPKGTRIAKDAVIAIVYMCGDKKIDLKNRRTTDNFD